MLPRYWEFHTVRDNNNVDFFLNFDMTKWCHSGFTDTFATKTMSKFPSPYHYTKIVLSRTQN